MVLVAWVLVLLSLLFLVVVLHYLRTVWETPDVPQSLSSLSRACLMF